MKTPYLAFNPHITNLDFITLHQKWKEQTFIYNPTLLQVWPTENVLTNNTDI